MEKIILKYDIEPFCCECSLVSDALDTLAYKYVHGEEDYSSVTIVAEEALTEAIMKYLLWETEIDIEYINFDTTDYNDAYCIILSIVDGELKLEIDMALAEGGYRTLSSDYIYVQEGFEDLIAYQDLENTEFDVFEITDDCE